MACDGTGRYYDHEQGEEEHGLDVWAASPSPHVAVR